MRYCTTLRQGRRLMELGVDPKTADMCYKKIAICNNDNIIDEEMTYSLEPISWTLFSGVGVPAWSVSALMEILPFRLRGIYFLFVDKDRYADCNDKIMYSVFYSDLDFNCIACYESEELSDALYKMIVTLKEEKII